MLTILIFLLNFLTIMSSSAADSVINPSDVLSFMNTVGKLKHVKRTGWVRAGVHLPESVADHMYKMSMMVFMIRDPSINRDRLMKLCMVHDLAESIVGDITPHCKVTKEEKRRLEETALRDIAADVNNDHVKEEIVTLWLEYENSSSAEATLAHQLDKLEMIIQANEYEEQQNLNLEDFFHSTRDSFSHPEILSWANELRAKRQLRLQGAVSRSEDKAL